ncbi:MAG: hypothetical protein RIQ89_408 [Bacteroidota bacterium]|jgi:predicted Rossmann fold flavoprotein
MANVDKFDENSNTPRILLSSFIFDKISIFLHCQFMQSFSDQHIAVIGGGAAGFFGAIACAQALPDAKVTIYEQSTKLLSKVAISGGGRCNVTHACFDINLLVKNYPRGEKQLKSVFSKFSPTETVAWFKNRNVKLKTEDDGRMFPITDSSETIIKCLIQEAKDLNINISFQKDVSSVRKKYDDTFELTFSDGTSELVSKILVATGGHPTMAGFKWLADLKHQIIPPVPSLFTFNIDNKDLNELTGIAVPMVQMKVQNTSYKSEGPLLITHFGFSGPATLKLSSMACRTMAESDYQNTIIVTWISQHNEMQIRNHIAMHKANEPKKSIYAHNPWNLPNRLWVYLLQKAVIVQGTQWANVSKEQVNKLVNVLIADSYQTKGKNTFKEEFVTSGGVSLENIDFKNMQSKKCKGLFFAGEVLDIDAFTGGFNFQAAWATGFVAGQGIANAIIAHYSAETKNSE